jgi:uncharacterized protein (TIGR02466 family)
MSEYKLSLLFPTPVLETEIAVNKKIVDHIKSLDYTRTDYNNAHISVSMDVLEDPIMKDSSEKIHKAVEHYAREVICLADENRIERVASWGNIYDIGDWSQTHNHTNSYITGVWFLQTLENCSDLTLEGWGFSPIMGFPIDFPIGCVNEINSIRWDLSAEVGKLYVFPSICKHSVGKNQSKGQRISLAFNYYIRSDGILSENKLIKS